jgi:hypothetical protein
MKGKLLFLGFTLTVLIFASPPAAEAAVNMLANPSFEIDDDGNGEPDDWGLWGSSFSPGGGDSTQEWLTDPAQAVDGNVSVHLRAGGNDYAMAIPTRIPATPGEVYYFAFYVKDLLPDGTQSISEPEFKMEFFAGGTRDDSLTYAELLQTEHDGEYHLVWHEVTCPDGIDEILPIPQVSNWTGSGQSEYIWDLGSFSTELPPDLFAGAATNPNPPDGDSTMPLIEELSWTNPEAASPAEHIECDVWFSYDFPEYGNHEGDPNFLNYATQILFEQPVSSVSLLDLEPPLAENQNYYWRVDCYDPNKIDIPDEYFTVGDVWTFDTFNQPPEVEAGRKQKAWLTEATVSLQLDATASDDGMPLDPGAVTLTWTVESGPAVIFSNDAVEDPLVTFNTTGRYVLKLTADDTDLSTFDTVIIDIFPADYTGLVAHWSLDEETGSIAEDSIGGHDGTLIDDAAWAPSDGQVAGAILLDGDGDYIKIDDSADADPMNTTWADFSEEITISCWIKVNEFTDDYQAIVSKSEDAYRIQRNGEGDSIWFTITPPSINAGVAGSLSVNDKKWHHITATYDNEFIRLYIDGYPDGETEYADGISVCENSLLIGENLGYLRSFNGLIDEVRIYEIGLPYDRILADIIEDGGKGSCGQVYKKTDVNQDCYTNLLDFAEIAIMWLKCSDVTEPSCFE